MELVSVPVWVWVWVGLAVVLACGAAVWLSRRSYRRTDDEVRRTIGTAWVPVGALLGVLAASPFFAGRPPLVVATYLLALVWALTLALVDLEVHRLPDALVLPAYPTAVLLLAACSAATGQWAGLLRALTCAGGAVLVFLILALLSPGAEGLGLGDVKLAGVLGALLGWLGWSSAALGLLTGFVLGGVAAAALLLLRRADRRSSISFGPAMLLGAYLWCLLPA